MNLLSSNENQIQEKVKLISNNQTQLSVTESNPLSKINNEKSIEQKREILKAFARDVFESSVICQQEPGSTYFKSKNVKTGVGFEAEPSMTSFLKRFFNRISKFSFRN